VAEGPVRRRRLVQRLPGSVGDLDPGHPPRRRTQAQVAAVAPEPHGRVVPGQDRRRQPWSPFMVEQAQARGAVGQRGERGPGVQLIEQHQPGRGAGPTGEHRLGDALIVQQVEPPPGVVGPQPRTGAGLTVQESELGAIGVHRQYGPLPPPLVHQDDPGRPHLTRRGPQAAEDPTPAHPGNDGADGDQGQHEPADGSLQALNAHCEVIGMFHGPALPSVSLPPGSEPTGRRGPDQSACRDRLASRARAGSTAMISRRAGQRGPRSGRLATCRISGRSS
jgi:hypothetical protein